MALVKIDRNGRITLPESIRNFLRSDLVRIEIENGRVILIPESTVGDAMSVQNLKNRNVNEVVEMERKLIGEERKSEESRN